MIEGNIIVLFKKVSLMLLLNKPVMEAGKADGIMVITMGLMYVLDY